MPTLPHVRPYRPSDHEALADICVRTGHEGQDSSSVVPDHGLLPSIFAHPYAYLEPDLVFVLDNGEGQAVGYVLGTANTPRFVEEFRTRWLPKVADRFPAPTGEPATPSEAMAVLLHRPERMVLPELAVYPAHLHIDLLPDWQGRGFGRALMNQFLDALHAKGVPAVHLCMSRGNKPARAFYERLGFEELAVPDPAPVWYLGRPTAR